MTSNPDSVEDDNESLDQLQLDLGLIEKMLKKQLEELEKAIPTFRDFQDEIPLEESSSSESISLLRISTRIKSMVKLHTLAQEALLKEIGKLKKQLNDQRFLIEEIEMERDVLLQQIHAYLETNSSLRVRLEEQRCQSGTLQKQLNADLELRIKLLEGEKEKLSNLNLVKDNELRRVNLLLEQTTNALRNKEAEVVDRKNEDNGLIYDLKSDLKKALDEKTCLEEKYASLKEQVVDYFMNKNVERIVKGKKSLRRSRSLGDMNCDKPGFLEKNILLEPPDSPRAGTRQRYKNTPKAEPNPEALLSKAWILESQSQPNAEPSPKTPSVHTQLNALKKDLMNVTRKLESLKCQLLVSGAIEEEPKKTESRSLKRKAKPIDDSEASEDQNLAFRNLKNILQDAKNLNVKLQNLREEKQKIIEQSKKEAGVQTSGINETRQRSFQRAVMTLKKAVSECEEKLDGGVITEEEAFAGLVSPFYACILRNSRCFHECRRRAGSDETDPDSLMDDGSTEVSSPREDGGGDNLLKKQVSSRGLDCRELKSQTSHLKCKIQQEI